MRTETPDEGGQLPTQRRLHDGHGDFLKAHSARWGCRVLGVCSSPCLLCLVLGGVQGRCSVIGPRMFFRTRPFFLKCSFIWPLLPAALRLCCRAAFSPVDPGLLTTVASLVAQHWLWSTGSEVEHGLSCSTAREIFLDQGSNPCLQAGTFFTTEPPGKPAPRILDERRRGKRDLAGSTTAQHLCGRAVEWRAAGARAGQAPSCLPPTSVTSWSYPRGCRLHARELDQLMVPTPLPVLLEKRGAEGGGVLMEQDPTWALERQVGGGTSPTRGLPHTETCL